MSGTDGVNYSINNVVLNGGNVKLRQSNAWDIQWGGAAVYPTNGDLIRGGGDMPTTAGVYDIVMNRVTSATTFTPSLATTTFSTNNFKVYPNPTTNNWNFVSSKNAITSVQIVDVLGKVVFTVTGNSNEAKVNASSLNTGIYFAKIATANATETIKLVKN
jgi:starch-binding outer membrane protein SusE/F